ncbi:hypothetical protein Pcinc_035091 [Petrolisthes cinctipes]|uniref:Uncharacterized protein n=1 Tax=Petrolisthes cinctipes TaxID=88211 RepID=A0AAE1ENM2_PETCI|nr:hypothetical protein Pcinc_035091 [Petrolisthes cinctipes]
MELDNEQFACVTVGVCGGREMDQCLGRNRARHHTTRSLTPLFLSISTIYIFIKQIAIVMKVISRRNNCECFLPLSTMIHTCANEGESRRSFTKTN